MNTKQKAALVAKAHHLKPVVMIGQKGLTDNVIAETELALTAHELIKVKVIADDKEQRSMIVGQICSTLNAEPLKLIGNIAIIYRKSSDT